MWSCLSSSWSSALQTTRGRAAHRPPRPRVAAAAASAWSAGLDDHQRVAVDVAEPEHRRDGVAHTLDLVVDVDAGGLEIGVVGVHVLAVQRDTGLDPDRVALARGHDRDR